MHSRGCGLIDICTQVPSRQERKHFGWIGHCGLVSGTRAAGNYWNIHANIDPVYKMSKI